MARPDTDAVAQPMPPMVMMVMMMAIPDTDGLPPAAPVIAIVRANQRNDIVYLAIPPMNKQSMPGNDNIAPVIPALIDAHDPTQ